MPSDAVAVLRHLLVEREKISDYLLNLRHPHGAAKARFFLSFGFEATNWMQFATALRHHGESGEIVCIKETGYGPRFEVQGPILSPDGRCPCIKTIWQLDDGQVAPPPGHCISSGPTMIKEHERAVLTSDMPAERLQAGDVGTVVHVHNQGEAYEIEFVTLTGHTVAVATVLSSQCRPVGERDISHVRELHAA